MNVLTFGGRKLAGGGGMVGGFDEKPGELAGM